MVIQSNFTLSCVCIIIKCVTAINCAVEAAASIATREQLLALSKQRRSRLVPG